MGPAVLRAEDAEPIVNCFYQFNDRALFALTGRDGVGRGAGFLNIMVQSEPTTAPRAKPVQVLRACGQSFKYAYAMDVKKYRDWKKASPEKLREWAGEFRRAAMDAEARADYFAFNEAPADVVSDLNVRSQIGKWLRELHDEGSGLHKLRGILYLTEKAGDPREWKGATGDFWKAVDETCDYVIVEHYHAYSFVMEKSADQLAEHFFALPRWLEANGDASARNVAKGKLVVAHSAYYGPRFTGWGGLKSNDQSVEEYQKYLEKLMEATRLSPYGKRRIGFAPLAGTELDNRMYEVLARVLHRDAGRGL